MDFLRAIVNNQELTLDEDFERALEQLITEENIEERAAIDRVSDRVKIRNIALYRPIVGTANLMATKRFLDLARDGKSVPSSLLKGYLPAIEMLDEIVAAGPAYVQTLRALHNRAKKQP